MDNLDPFKADDGFSSLIGKGSDKDPKVEEIKGTDKEEGNDNWTFIDPSEVDAYREKYFEEERQKKQKKQGGGSEPPFGGFLPTKLMNDASSACDELVPTERKEEVQKTFNSLYNDLNQKYNLNLRMDSNSFSELMRSLIDNKNRQALELYTSTAFGMFRSLIYNKYLQTIYAISEQILDPEYILSEAISYDDKLNLMERLFKFMGALEQVYATVNIENSDMKLAHLSDQTIEQHGLGNKEDRELLERLLNRHKNETKAIQQGA